MDREKNKEEDKKRDRERRGVGGRERDINYFLEHFINAINFNYEIYNDFHFRFTASDGL